MGVANIVSMVSIVWHVSGMWHAGPTSSGERSQCGLRSMILPDLAASAIGMEDDTRIPSRILSNVSLVISPANTLRAAGSRPPPPPPPAPPPSPGVVTGGGRPAESRSLDPARSLPSDRHAPSMESARSRWTPSRDPGPDSAPDPWERPAGSLEPTGSLEAAPRSEVRIGPAARQSGKPWWSVVWMTEMIVDSCSASRRQTTLHAVGGHCGHWVGMWWACGGHVVGVVGMVGMVGMLRPRKYCSRK